MKSLKSKKGITLIALVITIIVLLILAGVSINAVIGEDGIATKAKLAKEETAIAEDKEKINFAIAEYEMESIEDDSKSLEEFLKSQDWCEDAVFDDDSKMVTVTMANGSKYEIEVSGNVNDKEDSKWDSILEEANSNPEKYKHSEQLVSNYIAIGTDGKPVNMDLWNPTKRTDGDWALGMNGQTVYASVNKAYNGTIENGEIVGKVPEYIYDVEKNVFKPVTEMYGTFGTITSLIKAPNIPETVKYMDFTFYHCDNLEETQKFPSLVESIGGTYCYCKSLIKGPIVPASVTNVWAEFEGNKAVTFKGCDSLTSIVVDEGNLIYDSRNGCNAIIETSSNTLLRGCNNSFIPTNIKKIENEAFSGLENLTPIEIPDGVTTIGSNAFSYCSGLTSVIIPNSVTSIGYGAFSYCSGLTSVIIPNSVTNIETYAFNDCTDLSTVYFEQTTVPTFSFRCFFKSSGGMTTFYFKNSTVADAFTTSYYNSSYGTKSTNYNW